jgi:hypothetical protein
MALTDVQAIPPHMSGMTVYGGIKGKINGGRQVRVISEASISEWGGNFESCVAAYIDVPQKPMTILGPLCKNVKIWDGEVTFPEGWKVGKIETSLDNPKIISDGVKFWGDWPWGDWPWGDWPWGDWKGIYYYEVATGIEATATKTIYPEIELEPPEPTGFAKLKADIGDFDEELAEYLKEMKEYEEYVEKMKEKEPPPITLPARGVRTIATVGMRQQGSELLEVIVSGMAEVEQDGWWHETKLGSISKFISIPPIGCAGVVPIEIGGAQLGKAYLEVTGSNIETFHLFPKAISYLQDYEGMDVKLSSLSLTPEGMELSGKVKGEISHYVEAAGEFLEGSFWPLDISGIMVTCPTPGGKPKLSGGKIEGEIGVAFHIPLLLEEKTWWTPFIPIHLPQIPSLWVSSPGAGVHFSVFTEIEGQTEWKYESKITSGGVVKTVHVDTAKTPPITISPPGDIPVLLEEFIQAKFFGTASFDLIGIVGWEKEDWELFECFLTHSEGANYEISSIYLSGQAHEYVSEYIDIPLTGDAPLRGIPWDINLDIESEGEIGVKCVYRSIFQDYDRYGVMIEEGEVVGRGDFRGGIFTKGALTHQTMLFSVGVDFTEFYTSLPFEMSIPSITWTDVVEGIAELAVALVFPDLGIAYPYYKLYEALLPEAFEGCTPEEEMRVVMAAMDVMQRIENCPLPADLEEELLSELHEYLTPGGAKIVCGHGGEHLGLWIPGWSITLYDVNTRDVQDVAATLFHELVHAAGGGETAAEACTALCYPDQRPPTGTECELEWYGWLT